MWRRKLKENPENVKLLSLRLPPTHTLSDTGSITLLGDPKEAEKNLALWRTLEDEMISSAIRLIEEWKTGEKDQAIKSNL